MTAKRRNWILGIVSVALFMVVLDNLVVSVALPSIRRGVGVLGAGALMALLLPFRTPRAAEAAVAGEQASGVDSPLVVLAGDVA